MIKPYYKDGDCTIYHGKCEDVIPSLDLDSIDLILTDPPYEQQKAGAGLAKRRSRLQQISNELSDFSPAFLSNLVKQVGHAYVFHGKAHLSYWHNFAELEVDFNWDCLVYGKNNPIPLKNNRYLSDIEFIFFCRSKEKDCYWNNEARFDCYRKIKMVDCKASGYDHPTVKDIGVLEQFLVVSSKPGQSVLDPYVGSGTTLVAARNLKRKCIGIEKEEKYCEIAAKRLAQGVLF